MLEEGGGTGRWLIKEGGGTGRWLIKEGGCAREEWRYVGGGGGGGSWYGVKEA